MAGYKTYAQARGHQQAMQAQAAAHLKQALAGIQASAPFNAKYRGKCAHCEGTGIISQGNQCVMRENEILHLECAFRYHERCTPCAACNAQGELKAEGPVSGKRVCSSCAMQEILGAK
jgi:DnaJ-class molecular chaperone